MTRTNLQHNNLQYLLTKKLKPNQQQENSQQNNMLSPPEINIEGTDVGREEGLTFLP